MDICVGGVDVYRETGRHLKCPGIKRTKNSPYRTGLWLSLKGKKRRGTKRGKLKPLVIFTIFSSLKEKC